jgi:hypothetical protein
MRAKKKKMPALYEADAKVDLTSRVFHPKAMRIWHGAERWSCT